MKKTVRNACFLFLLLGSSFPSFSQGWWFRKADYNLSSRTSAIAFSIGTGGFVGTGYDSTSFRRNISVYNQINDTWTSVTSLGGSTGSGLSRDAAISFSIGTKAYVGLGQGSNPYLNDFWEYDAGSDVWTQKANFGGSARRAAAAFTANNKGYVTCGQDISGFKKDMWMYDPAANTWTAKSDFPGTARRLPVAFSISNIGFVGTGDDGAFTNDFYRYNAASDSWISIPSFGGTPRYAASCFVIGTDGYVGTGYDNTLANTKDFWKYNSLTNSWSQVKDFSGSARSNAVGFAIGSFGYIATGYDSLTTTKDLWVYDPNSNGIDLINAFKNSLLIYPNPMHESATLSFDETMLNAFGDIQLRLYDLQGKCVMQLNKLSSNKTAFSRSELSTGCYVYCVTGDQLLIKTGKIIVE